MTPVQASVRGAQSLACAYNERLQQSNPGKGLIVDKLNELMKRGVSRRKFLAGAGASVGAAAAIGAVGCSGPSTPAPPPPVPTPAGLTDNDVLNFALNLEYLEAEFYLRAATGTGLTAANIGANPGTVTGGTQVPFATPALKAYALEIAANELAHVRLLRGALGSAAVDRPAIDLTNSFNAAAMAAGIGPAFNPFADENSFIVGAFTFEDVGVTAYHGASALLQSKTILGTAAGILAVEAYHAAEIRTILNYLGAPYLTYANQISTLRATAGGGAETPVSPTTIVAADPKTSIAYGRTTDQVLHIVYLSAAAGVVSSGGFFPNGLNGTIKTTAS